MTPEELETLRQNTDLAARRVIEVDAEIQAAIPLIEAAVKAVDEHQTNLADLPCEMVSAFMLPAALVVLREQHRKMADLLTQLTSHERN